MGMMLHRHFSDMEKPDVKKRNGNVPETEEPEFESDIFPTDEAQPKRKGRPRKT